MLAKIVGRVPLYVYAYPDCGSTLLIRYSTVISYARLDTVTPTTSALVQSIQMYIVLYP